MKHACRLHLLTKRYEIRLLSFLEAPLFVRPECPGGTDARLNFVDDEECAVFLGDEAEGTEEGGRGVFVAAFGEDGFDDDCCDWFVGFTNGPRISMGMCLREVAAGTYLSTRIFSYSARHRSSSALFRASFSSRGYLISGKGAAGQSKAGTSTYPQENRPSDRIRCEIKRMYIPCGSPCSASHSSSRIDGHGSRI
jgi:hypothetical protein